MKWEITGADRESGKDVSLQLEAETETDAAWLAGARGVVVSEVKPAEAPTLEYVSPGGARAIDVPVDLDSVSRDVGEKVFLYERGVLVSVSRVSYGGSTHAMQSVASVEMIRRSFRLATLGSFLIGVGVVLMILCLLSGGAQIWWVFALLIVAGIVLKNIPGPSAVRITLNSGNPFEIDDADEMFLRSVMNAVNDALVARR